MSSFRQTILAPGQFIVPAKIFAATQDNKEFMEMARQANLYRALVDTGATGCCITEKVVDDVGLHPYSHMKIGTAGMPHVLPVYFVGIGVSVKQTAMREEKQDDGSVAMKQHVISESFSGFPKIKVAALSDTGQDRGFDVILGMDLLINFHITIQGGEIIISI